MVKPAENGQNFASKKGLKNVVFNGFPHGSDAPNYPKNDVIFKFFIRFVKVFTILAQFLFLFFLMVFPIVLMDEITEKMM